MSGSQNGKPPDPGDTKVTSPKPPPPTLHPSGTTSAWAAGAGLAGTSRKQRSFAEIIAEQKSTRNIMEIHLTKKLLADEEGKVTKFRHLTFDEIGSFIFDILKIPATSCQRFNYITSRYDTKEVMLKAGVEMSPFLGSYEFMNHEITVRKQRNNITKVIFKSVPLNVPDEEIINLCEVYGKPVDFVVHYEKLNNQRNRGHESGNRYVEMELFPGASFNNFYWLEGPLAGDVGGRATVLHPSQIQQCSHCLQLANKGCPGHGNGKACESLGTTRGKMNVYMEEVRQKHGYKSLKMKYYEQFPTPGGAGNFGLSKMEETSGSEEDGVVPKNPIEERDGQIAALKTALEESRKEVSDVNVMKEKMLKMKQDMRNAKREVVLAKNKLEFARKVTDQRLTDSLCAPHDQEEMAALYATLVDEDMFELGDGDEIVNTSDLLKEVEDKIVKERPEGEHTALLEVKSKILERVKRKKVERRERRDSFSSVDSLGMKRTNSESAGGDQNRVKTDTKPSRIVKPSLLPSKLS